MRKCISLAVSILVAAVLLSLLPIHGEEQIYDRVLRLHVLAASDSERDQAVKLVVRDRILETVSPLLTDVQDRDTAAAIVTANIPALQESAQETLESLGRPEQVVVTLTKENYPTRAYEGCTLPAGRYLSLRVIIGEGAGQNWWCVLFPSVCGHFATARIAGANFAEASEDGYLQAGLTPAQYRLITHTEEPDVQVRFRLLEWLDALQQALAGETGAVCGKCAVVMD